MHVDEPRITPLLERYLHDLKDGSVRAWVAFRYAVRETQRLAGRERSPDRLFVTDLTKCPRQVAYRLLGEHEEPASLGKTIMFQEAEDIEWHVAAACRYAGVLADYQFPIEFPERDNWGGRGDLLLDWGQIVDVKSMRSSAFRGAKKEIPKPDHEVQQSVYFHHHRSEVIPGLFYVDRGGQNAPEEVSAVVLTPKDEVMRGMDALDELRDSIRSDGAKALPRVLPTEITVKNRRASCVTVDGFGVVDFSGELWDGPSWRCGSYCGYTQCPAKGAANLLLAKTTKSAGVELTSHGKRNIERILEFYREQTGTYQQALDDGGEE